MSEEIPQHDPPLTPEQEVKVARLSDKEINEIDKELLSQACDRWRKVARIVGLAMNELEERVIGIPDVYYSQRVRLLVESGHL